MVPKLQDRICLSFFFVCMYVCMYIYISENRAEACALDTGRLGWILIGVHRLSLPRHQLVSDCVYTLLQVESGSDDNVSVSGTHDIVSSGYL